ncbi:FxSxx-COOH cyclophane-containing RiPP peptide [Planomonospora algeriensis]
MAEEAAAATATATGMENGLIDVNGLDLRDLDLIDGSVLGEALRRLTEGDAAGPVAGFSAGI